MGDDNAEELNQYYEPWEFDNEALEHLHNNDPHLDSLHMFSGTRSSPLKVDWGKEGSAISNNTHLTSLEIDQFALRIVGDREQRYAERNARNFYRAISENKSIDWLKMEGCIVRDLLSMKEVFSILTPTLQNLCSLNVRDISLDCEIMELLARGCTSKLRCIGLNNCEGMNTEIMTKMVEILTANQNIKELYLNEYDMDKEVAVILGNGLCNSSIKDLHMNGYRCSDDYDRAIGSIAEGGMECIARCLSRPNCLVEEIYLHDNHISIEGALCLLEELSENNSLKVLDLYGAVSPRFGNRIMSSYGWETFFDLLGQIHSPLHTLNLGDNTIGDDQVDCLVEALNSMGSLKNLNLEDTGISSSGWKTFFQSMQRPGSVLGRLRKLNLEVWRLSPLKDEGLIALANCLHGNTSLKRLHFAYIYSGEKDEVAMAALSKALYDGSSIESIYNSNHTLSEDIRFKRRRPRLPPDSIVTIPKSKKAGLLQSLLALNKGKNKNKVIRQKIIRYYYSDDNNLHEITNLDDEVLPHVLSTIGKTQINVASGQSAFDLLYKIVLGSPSLFEINKVRKRKRRT